MRAKVKVKKSQLDYFRTLARNTHLEIQAYLIGQVESPLLTRVDSFAYTKRYNKQSPGQVSWSGEEYSRLLREADDQNKRIVGFIHSHPEWDAVMSPNDHSIMAEDGFRICGICSTNGRKTRVRFWVPESSLPCEIEYE